MNTSEVLKIVDHTLLTQTATWEDIKTILDDGIKYETASACIPAAYVKQAVEYVEGKLPICTVIGFPNGYSTTATKVFETKDAIANGASEIDMVINIGFLKDGRYDEVEEEIRQIHEACDGKILKVIIETCLLTEEEKIKMCEIVTKAGAEFIKTSTGFSTAGATFEDVKRTPLLMVMRGQIPWDILRSCWRRCEGKSCRRNQLIRRRKRIHEPRSRQTWNKPSGKDHEKYR